MSDQLDANTDPFLEAIGLVDLTTPVGLCVTAGLGFAIGTTGARLVCSATRRRPTAPKRQRSTQQRTDPMPGSDACAFSATSDPTTNSTGRSFAAIAAQARRHQAAHEPLQAPKPQSLQATEPASELRPRRVRRPVRRRRQCPSLNHQQDPAQQPDPPPLAGAVPLDEVRWRVETFDIDGIEVEATFIDEPDTHGRSRLSRRR